jgi:ABC-type Fe3+-hydroxamate transport system substrate-binding protein
MPYFTDQLGRTIQLTHTPQKIISLVPSQTELLHDLGLEKEVAGITTYCIHPEPWFHHKIKVGGTKNINRKRVDDIQPDLIIANKEENNREQIEELAQHYPVWTSNISTLSDALEMIRAIGNITGKSSKAEAIAEQISAQFTGFFEEQPHPHRVTAAYLIWRKPYMSVGSDTFIHEMMKYCGFQNAFASALRYPRITIEQLQATLGPGSLLLLSSEPFPFKQKHIDELQPDLPHTQIVLADGEMFSWYGSRLLQAPAYFRKLLKQIQ